MPTPLSFSAQPSGGWSHPGGSAAGSAARAGPSKARPGLLEPGKVGAGRCARATPEEPRLRRKIVVATDNFLIPDRFLPGNLFFSLAPLLARSLARSLVRSLAPSLLPSPGGGRVGLKSSVTQRGRHGPGSSRAAARQLHWQCSTPRPWLRLRFWRRARPGTGSFARCGAGGMALNGASSRASARPPSHSPRPGSLTRPHSILPSRSQPGMLPSH